MKEKNESSESEDAILEKDYYSIEYPGQNISRRNSFKKWYSKQKEKIRIENEFKAEIKENIKSSEFFVEEDIIIKANSFLFISLCKNCQCYSIHSLIENSIFAKCSKCQKEYCIGCSVPNYSNDKNKICFKGYFKTLYLRIINEEGNDREFEVMEYVFLFMITIIIMPIYLALISCFSTFNRHPDKPYNKDNIKINNNYEIYKVLFQIFFSMLYFIYIISFLPFLFIIASIIFFIPFLRKKFLIIYEPIIG